MRLATAVLITLLLPMPLHVFGQPRRNKRAPAKPSTQQTQPKDDPNTIRLLHSENGRDYYLFQVEKSPETDVVFYSYVVFFDETTPAGRSALSRTVALAKLSLVDLNQMYYVAAVQYHCFFKLSEPNKTLYAEVIWTDKSGNEIVKLQVKPEDTVTIQDQVAEIAAYSEPYLQKVFDTLDESNEAQRRNFESRMNLAIALGREDEARRMKFEPNLPRYLPALSLVISGGPRHMSDVLKAAKQASEKPPRKTK